MRLAQRISLQWPHVWRDRRHLQRSMLGLTHQIRTMASRHLPGSDGPGCLLLVGEHAHADDDTRFLLAMLSVIRRETDLRVRVLLKHDGLLLPRFLALADTTLLDSRCHDDLVRWFRHSGCDRAIFNGCATGDLIEAARSAELHCVALINEPTSLVEEEYPQAHANEIAHLARHLVFPSAKVRQEFLEQEPFIRAAVHQLAPPAHLLFEAFDRSSNADQLRHRLDLKPEDRLVVGSGRANRRRGFDRFLSSAERLCRRHPHLHFCWLGRRSRDMRRWLRTHRPDIPERQLHLLDDAENLTPWLQAADCLYLASRYDAYPHSALMARTMGTPIVKHEGATACDGTASSGVLRVPAGEQSVADDQLLQAIALPRTPSFDDGSIAGMQQHQTLSSRDYIMALLRLATPESTPRGSQALPANWMEGHAPTLVNG